MRLFRGVQAALSRLVREVTVLDFLPAATREHILDDRKLLKHPVTHVSWRDAVATPSVRTNVSRRKPSGSTLPAAVTNSSVSRGDRLTPDGKFRCNTWQGEFPEHNTGADGYLQTAPVDAFGPNDYGLYNVVGNVWEWCLDWFSPDYHRTDEYDHDNPTGPESGDERVMRGGSHLCHRSWYNRYRLGARSKNISDSSAGNIGFRCVVDAAGG